MYVYRKLLAGEQGEHGHVLGNVKMSSCEKTQTATQDDDIVAMCVHATSVIWKWLRFLKLFKQQRDNHGKICRWPVPAKNGKQQRCASTLTAPKLASKSVVVTFS